MSDPEADDSNTVDPELVPEVPEGDYSRAGVPTFDYVRDRIENRFATAVGATELAGLGGEQDIASLDKKLAERDKAARDKLAEIRRAMRSE
jgi:phage shock protein A